MVAAVKDVSLTIRRGETLGIVGESGSGKSTVARCVARLVDVTDGGIKIDGIDIAAMRESKFRPMRRRVQFIFQDPYRSLNPRRTVGEAIIEGPMNFGLSRKEAMQRARDLMAMVHLPPAAIDRFPHQFSGGQRQRICIARALAMEPELLIGDEPVSALDVSVQDQVLKLLDEVRRKFDLAVLFITHDLRVAAQVCDRIAVMQRGVIVEQGATADVFAAPQHEYTKALFDAAPGRHQEFAASAYASSHISSRHCERKRVARMRILLRWPRMDCFASLRNDSESQQWVSRISSRPSLDSGEGICGWGWDDRRSGDDLRAGGGRFARRLFASHVVILLLCMTTFLLCVAFLRPDARRDVPALIRRHVPAPDPPQNARRREAPRNDRARR